MDTRLLARRRPPTAYLLRNQVDHITNKSPNTPLRYEFVYFGSWTWPISISPVRPRFENYPKDVKEAYPKRRTALVAVVETLYDRRRCIQRKKAD
ncbi:hypothetical protein T265_15003, partial [Opisthorchis viverrini]